MRLDEVVLRALERERERRYQHASEVRTRVDGIAATEGKAPAAAPTSPRLSRLAVVGALTVPAGAMLAGLLFLLVDAFAPPGRGNAIGTGVVMTFGAAVVVTGLLVSMIAIGAIRRSRGALYGMGWAVTGCVLPLTLVLVFFAMALVRQSAVQHEVAVAGRARVEAEVRAFWERDRAELDRDRPFDERARFLAPSERRAFDEMSKAERNDAAGAGRLGIPFLHPADSLTTFEVVRVALEPSRTRGRVVLTNGKWTLAFPVAYEDGRWHAAMGPVELMPRTPQAGDEKGWVDDWYFGRGDLADRVSGVPGMSAGERHRHAQAMHSLWAEHGNDVVPVNATGTARDFRVHHLHLEGRDAGRLVLSDGKSTIVVPVALIGDVWALGEEIVETRAGPARPDDRTGRLDDRFFGRGDLADRVSGVPGLSSVERHAHAEAMHALWAERGRSVNLDAARRPSDVHVLRAEAYRVYHLHLEDAESGRLVLAHGGSTIVVPVRRAGGAWVLGEAVVEAVSRAAGPEDRDGRLSR